MPSDTQIELSLIIPAFNESAIILRNIGELRSWMTEHLPQTSYEVIVVDDGSNDGMGDLIDGELASTPELRLVRHPRNMGRGRGIRTGFEHAQGRYVICLDADLSYAPYHIKRLLEPLQAGIADITLASAYHPQGTVTNVPTGRRIMSVLGNRVLSAGFKSPIRTVTCVVRGYRRAALESLELINDGKDLHLEILQKAELFGLRLHEIPADLRWRDRTRGKTKRSRIADYVPFMSMSGTIASHLVYSYVLRPGALLTYPAVALLLIAATALLTLAGAWIGRIAAAGSVAPSALYGTLRETLIAGQLTMGVMAAALIVAAILGAFYFAAQQNKRNHDEIYILMSRMNARLKDIERERTR
jgi:glycosyltransferase involved in cell wall biosynthesis